MYNHKNIELNAKAKQFTFKLTAKDFMFDFQ